MVWVEMRGERDHFRASRRETGAGSWGVTREMRCGRRRERVRGIVALILKRESWVMVLKWEGRDWDMLSRVES